MRIFYITFLIAFYSLGLYLCKIYLCEDEQTIQKEISPIITKDDCRTRLIFKDGDLDIISKDNFTFFHSSSEIIPPSDALLENVKIVVEYLQNHNDRMIQIKGLYTQDEYNNSDNKTIGLSRGNMVKSFFIDQGILPEQIMYIGKLTRKNCFADSILQKGISVAFGQKK